MEHLPGTALVYVDDPRVPAKTFFGDPDAGTEFASYAALFNPNRGPEALDVSLPWITELKAIASETQFNSSLLDFYFFNLKSLTFDNLTRMETGWQINVGEVNPYTLSFPAMTDFNGSINDANETLVSLDCPEVTTINSVSQNINFEAPLLTDLNFPKLSYIMGDIDIGGAPMTKLNFPALRTMDNGVIQFVACPMLTDITSLFGLTLVKNSSELQIAGALSTATVNAFLIALATNLSATSAGSTINVSGQTPPAPPSGAGVAAKTTLQGYGMTILTD